MRESYRRPRISWMRGLDDVRVIGLKTGGVAERQPDIAAPDDQAQEPDEGDD